MNHKSWIGVMIPLGEAWRDVIAAELFGLGCTGIEERANGLYVTFEQSGEKDWREAVSRLVRRYDPGFDAVTLECTVVRAENWNENWKIHFKPFRLGRHIVIRPEWETANLQPGDVELVITPKMAFGTGHHETTRLILELLEEQPLANHSLLDAGTGSGILALYAVKQGAGPVTAFDIDPEATANALENEKLNALEGRIRWITGVLNDVPPAGYDYILANINRNVLLELPAEFIRYSHPGTHLILSGLLHTDEDAVRAAYEGQGWQVTRRAGQGEWMAISLKRQNQEKNQ